MSSIKLPGAICPGEGPNGGPCEAVYTLSYNTATGGLADLNRIVTPHGASIDLKYSLEGTAASSVLSWYDLLYDAVTEVKRTHLTEFGETKVETTTYTYLPTGDQTEVLAPDGGVTRYFYPQYTKYGNHLPKSGLVDRVEYPDGSVLVRTWNENRPFGVPTNGTNFHNPYVFSETITTAGKAFTRTYTLDKNGNTTRIQETDYDGRVTTTNHTYRYPTLEAPATPLDEANLYANSIAPRWLTARTGTEVTAGWVEGRVAWGSGEATAMTRKEIYEYDADPAPPALPVVTGPRKVRRWDSARSSSGNLVYADTEYTYDSLGNVLTVIEPGRNDSTRSTTKYTYWPGTIGAYGAGNLVEKIERAFGTAVVKQTVFHAYDGATGLVRSMTNEAGAKTDINYDAAGRVLWVDEYVLWDTIKRRTQYSYSFLNRRVVEKRDRDTFGDGKWVQVRHMDRLGRLSLHRVLESAGDDEKDKTKGIKTEHRYHTDGTGRYHLVSNPYRTLDDTTMGWRRTRMDRMGRVVQVRFFHGTNVPGWTEESTDTSGATTAAHNLTIGGSPWVYSEYTDQAGKKQRSGVDGMGRIRSVIEDYGGLGYTTTYEYTANGDLNRVMQGAQTRSFGMTSLGRVAWASNPESGVTSYSYDLNGNLVSRTDARGIVTTNWYDALNRVTLRSYTGATPAVTYCYDGKVGGGGDGDGVCSATVEGLNQSNRLTEVRNSVSRTRYESFDRVGRVLKSTQIVAGQGTPYGFLYDYSLGGLRQVTYPSGRVVVQTLDNAGRVEAVGLAKSGTVVKLAEIRYAAHGGVSGRSLGNGVCDYLLYNGRLQVYGGGVFRQTNEQTNGPGQEQACRNGANNDYYAEFGWSYAPANAPTANNGNVREHTVTHAPNLDVWFVQSYTYDGLNRVKKVEEWLQSQPGAVLRRQTYVYDRYGNRALLNEAQAPVLGDAMPKAVVGVDTEAAAGAVYANNRWTGGMYDAAGNLYQIGTPGQEGYRSFVYDGENRVTSTTVVRGGQTAAAANWYDGEGRRVKKVRGTSETVYVYDAQGQLAAEYGNVNPVELGITYGTRDMLGSTRVVTGVGGSLRRRIDYWPFGEEVSGLDRGNAPQYGGNVYPGPRDMVDEKFTGKERDAETGLDYFGARYFSGAQGRFTGPDPLLNSGRPWEPQSWNRYAYALNNPLRFNDPTGLYEWAASGCADDDKKCLKQYQQNQDRFRQGLRSLEKARDAYKKGSREYNRLDSALQAYGKENDPNGVKVGFAALSGSAEGRTIPENNLASFTVLFDPKKIGGSGTDWGITVGHEGTHVSDFRLSMSDLQLLTPFSVEYRGYETSAFTFQGLFSGSGTGELSFGKGGNRVVIWNTGWAEADRQTLRDKGITKHVVNAYGHPETTPHNPLNQ